jgi:hypothetical protein
MILVTIDHKHPRVQDQIIFLFNVDFESENSHEIVSLSNNCCRFKNVKLTLQVLKFIHWKNTPTRHDNASAQVFYIMACGSSLFSRIFY